MKIRYQGRWVPIVTGRDEENHLTCTEDVGGVCCPNPPTYIIAVIPSSSVSGIPLYAFGVCKECRDDALGESVGASTQQIAVM